MKALPPPNDIWGQAQFTEEYIRLQRLCDLNMISEWVTLGAEIAQQVGEHIFQRIKYLEGLSFGLRPQNARGNNAFTALTQQLQGRLPKVRGGESLSQLRSSTGLNAGWLSDARGSYTRLSALLKGLSSPAEPAKEAPTSAQTLSLSATVVGRVELTPETLAHAAAMSAARSAQALAAQELPATPVAEPTAEPVAEPTAEPTAAPASPPPLR